MRQKIIGFDLDGTLLNTIPLHIEAFIEAGKKVGVCITREDFLSQQSTTTEDIISHIDKSLCTEKVKKFCELKNNYIASNLHKIKPFPDTVKTLAELRKKNKIIILSNTPYKDILHYLENAGLNPLFFEMIIGRDLVKHPKPYPDEIFVAEKIEHHKLDYYIGDSVVDMRTGKKAGVRTIGIAHGFDKKEDLIKEKPFRVIDNLSELLAIIK